FFAVPQTLSSPPGATYTPGIPIGQEPPHTPFQGEGQTFTLTVTQDTFTGNGNDTILGPKAGVFGDQATLTDFDSLIFTGPNNQLIAAFDGDHSAVGVTITGIPIWQFQQDDTAEVDIFGTLAGLKTFNANDNGAGGSWQIGTTFQPVGLGSLSSWDGFVINLINADGEPFGVFVDISLAAAGFTGNDTITVNA